MRKSSLGRRSSIMSSCNETLVGSRPDKKSFLLQPGFSQTKRASSEDRQSFLRAAPQLQSVTKSRCDMSLLDNLPPCTPMYFSKNSALPSGSARPSRSRTSSVESSRFSSIGSLKCTKKEIRPINDKDFQVKSLKKVQDYFQRQPNSFQILDNSHNVKPMSLKKFINMADYLLKYVDERTCLTKENYIESLMKTAKLLNYGGKIDKSWLISVNAQHAWCHVIAFLVWLVDLVQLNEQVRNAADFLFPEPLCEDDDEELLGANIRDVLPCLIEQFQELKANKHSDINFNAEFDRADDLLLDQLLQKRGLTEQDFQVLKQEEMAVRSTIDNPEYQAEETRLQNQESDLQSLREAHANMKDYIDKTNVYLESRMNEVNRLENDIEELMRNIASKSLQRDKLQKDAEEIKHKVADANEDTKRRIELERVIQYNEKITAEISKSIYEVEVTAAKIRKKMEAPLIEYNNLIAIHVKDEPRLKQCIVDSMNLFNNPAVIAAMAEADKILKTLEAEWEMKCEEAKLLLQNLKSENNALQESEKEITKECQLKNKQINDAAKEKTDFMEQKEKEFDELQNSIKDYELRTAELIKNTPVVCTEELMSKKNHYEAQIKQMKDDIELAERYFSARKKVSAEMFIRLRNIVKDTMEKLTEIAEEQRKC